MVKGASTHFEAQWSCVFKHATTMLYTLVGGVDGVQKAVNIANDEVWKESQQNLTALIELAKKIEPARGELVQQPIKAIEGESRHASHDQQA